VQAGGSPEKRPIRSFVRREGRLTAGQQRALETLWPRWGVAAEGEVLDLDALFGRRAPRTLEIGFGNGTALAAMAEAAPEEDFIGIEVHRPGVGRLLLELERRGLENVRIFCADAAEVLARRIPDVSLERVLLWFPDPWPKKRHHKRRIVQPPFVAQVRQKLVVGGVFHLATDWEGYAEQMLAVLSGATGLCNIVPDGGYAPRPASRPETRFERRGQRLGHGVWDLLFARCE